MTEFVAQLGRHTVALTLPPRLQADPILRSLKHAAPATHADAEIAVDEAADHTFSIRAGSQVWNAGLNRGALLDSLLHCLAAQFSELSHEPLLRAGAVSWGDGAALIVGPEASGKSSLVAWFIERGLAFIGDDRVAIVDAGGSITGYPAPLAFSAINAAHLAELTDISLAPMVRTAERIYIEINDAWRAFGEVFQAGFMIFPHYIPDNAARLERMPVSTAARILKAQVTSTHAASGEMDLWHIKMARSIPAVALYYSNYGQIDGLLDRLTKLAIDDRLTPSAFNRFISAIGRPAPSATRKYPIPERSTRQFSPYLTIGMATYDDYDGVYFSLQAIRFYHPEILAEVEFLIIDNHPEGPCSAPLKSLERHVANLRYIPAGDVTGTAIRSQIFHEAGGEFVLCMDCHVLLAPGSLRQLIDYFRSVPLSRDLIQGPMIYDDLASISTHWTEGWRGGMFGQWGNDPAGANPANPPFAIPFQGLGVFACRREVWPGFNPTFRGFGGEEGYIHEKFRQAGGRTLCLPALRWLHRFNRPMGSPYPNKWEDRIRNYLIGFREIGWRTDELRSHFRELLGVANADRIIAAIDEEVGASEGSSGSGAPNGSANYRHFDLEAPYNLRDARVQFTAEVAVPILRDTFHPKSASCVGRAGALWLREFERHGIPTIPLELPNVLQLPADAADDAGAPHAADILCSLEIAGISTTAGAEKYVDWLTTRAPIVAFVLAKPATGDQRHASQLRASWAALFAKRGYQASDCLRPALTNDPRAETHYQQNFMVFSQRKAPRSKSPSATATPSPAPLSQSKGKGVSVIIPTYNGGAFLSQAIESILLQSHRDFELIIVNDGSTDNSGSIAEEYARVDSRIRVLHQAQSGVAAAYNAGVAAARFALIARLDSDDVALPERMALQVAFLEKNEHIAAVGGAMRYIDGEGNLLGETRSYPLTPEACHAALAEATYGPIANPTVMIRRASFLRVGGCRTQYKSASDFDLWLRMDEIFQLANVPDALVDYRIHGANMTIKKRFQQAVQAQIAKQAARLRRRSLPDPVGGWASLGLNELATFPMPDEERAQVYQDLFDTALANFEATNEVAYLKLADECLSQIPPELPPGGRTP